MVASGCLSTDCDRIVSVRGAGDFLQSSMETHTGGLAMLIYLLKWGHEFLFHYLKDHPIEDFRGRGD